MRLMEPQAIDLIARCAFLEFLLEVSHAHNVVKSPETFTAWRDDMLNLIRFHASVTGDDHGDGIAVQSAMLAIAEKYFERVESRAKEIAEGLSQQAQKTRQEYEN